MGKSHPDADFGFVRIANSILHMLCRTRIPGEARQIFDTIMRLTYGFNLKKAPISLLKFYEMTGLKKPTIKKALSKLNDMNIIVTQKGNAGVHIYGINKKILEWKPLPKKVTLPKKVISVTQKGNKSLPKKIISEPYYNKDTNKDNIKDMPFFEKNNKKPVDNSGIDENSEVYKKGLKYSKKLNKQEVGTNA